MKKIQYVLLTILIFNTQLLKVDDPGFPGGDPDVPIDRGVVALVIAGIYYGVKKINKNNQQKA